MIIYNYNPDTGEFIDSAQAEKSPLEKDVYLIPAYATKVRPPTAGENQAPVFRDDSWELVPDYRGVVYWLPDGSKHQVAELGVELPEGATTTDPGPTAEQVDKQRRSRYRAEVDPLVMEATIKRETGDNESADTLMQQAIQLRQDIQASLPWPA